MEPIHLPKYEHFLSCRKRNAADIPLETMSHDGEEEYPVFDGHDALIPRKRKALHPPSTSSVIKGPEWSSLEPPKIEHRSCVSREWKAPVFPQDVTPSADEAPVHIDVGGVIYTSTLKTLTKYPDSKLGMMFSGKLPLIVDKMKQHYFIDRDGPMFRHVLNFLRNDTILLPNDYKYHELLFREAQFFQLDAMARQVWEQMEMRDLVKPEMNSEFS